MKKTALHIFTTALVLSLSCPLWAGATAAKTNPTVHGTANASEPAPENGAVVAKQKIEEIVVKDQRRLEKSGKFDWVGYAMATVTLDKSDPRWGKSRIIAAQKAALAAENKFAKEYGQQISSEKIATYYSDANEDIPNFDPTEAGNSNQWERIYQKVMNLAEGKLNQALVDLGLDAKEFQNLPENQRHLKFRDAFKSSVSRSAAAELSGLLTFKTYEGFEDGEYQIAVLMFLSPKMKQLAWDIGHSRGNIAATEAKIGSTQLDTIAELPASDLVPDFGIKRLYDENGYPVLVSFGQWAISTSGNSKSISRKKKHAYKQAEAQADQALAEFLNSKINYSDLNESGEEKSITGVVDEQNFKSNEDITTIIDITREQSKKKSRVNIIGVRELRRWNAVHPASPGTLVLGVIRYWSPVNEKAMRKVRNWKAKAKDHKRKTASAPTLASPEKPFIRESEERMSLDDF